jgi:hypothetical protein
MNRTSVSLLAAIFAGVAAGISGSNRGGRSLHEVRFSSATIGGAGVLIGAGSSLKSRNQRQRRKRWRVQRSNGRRVR